VGILDGQQRNVVAVVAVIKPVQPHNVVEILLVVVVVLPPAVKGTLGAAVVDDLFGIRP
jgi:hypothetical protein